MREEEMREGVVNLLQTPGSSPQKSLKKGETVLETTIHRRGLSAPAASLPARILLRFQLNIYICIYKMYF